MDVKKLIMAIAVVGPAIAASALSAEPSEGIRAITRPSADVTLSFVQPGRVAEILFKEGAKVKTGQLLVRLDDAMEQAQLAQIQAKAGDTTQVRAAEASLAQKQVDLKKLEKAAERKAATELELEHARLNVKIADLSLELARFEHQQAGRQMEEVKIHVDNMRIKCPIDGTVEQVHVETGESVNIVQEVMRVVKIDPLWIDASVQTALATTLKPGDKLSVAFPTPNGLSVQGKVVYVASVADAASETLCVRIEVPNPSCRPAGEHCRIVLPSPAQP